jgi:glycosyltransferase involved in cell wall biosynthesis
MRVLVLTAHLIPDQMSLWEACAAAGTDVHLAGTLHGRSGEAFLPETGPSATIPTHVLKQRDLAGRDQLWWTYVGLRHLVAELDPDLVHVCTEPWGLLALQALRSNPRVVIHGADNQFTHGSRIEAGLRVAVTRRNLRRSAGYASWNSAGVTLARQHGLRPDKPTLVASPVLPHAAVPSPESRSAIRRRAGWNDDDVIVLHVGRLEVQKGVRILAEARRMLTAPRVRTVLVGGGSETDWLRQRGDLELLGQRSHAEATDLIAGADVVVVPSIPSMDWTEQFGRTAAEALASGRALIVSDSGALPEVVEDAAIVVPQGDPAALARAIDAVAADRGRQAELEQASARRARVFAPDAVAARVGAFWHDVMA